MRKKTKNEKKSNNFLYSETYILLENMFEETQFILLYSHYRFFTWQVTGNAVTPTPIQTFISFVDAIPRSKILRNRLGILTQILDFNSNGLFLLFIYFRQVPSIQGKKYINFGNQFQYKKYNERDRNISKTFVFIFHHSIQHEASGYIFQNIFQKDKEAFARE